MSIDATINDAFATVSAKAGAFVFWGPEIAGATFPLIVVWLAAAGIFFSFYLGFPVIRYYRHAFACLGTKYDEPGARGQTSNFQSLSACLSATIGLGNIAGVAVAISAGGPGAAFWMVVLGFFGMGSKFAEVMLGHKYREFPDPERPEEVSGGPMYYLKHAFARYNMPKIGAFMAAWYAILCVLGSIGGGNVFQANQVYQQVTYATGGDASFFADKGWLFGLILAAIAGLVTLGGVRSIASVASKLTPVMAIFYTVCGFVVLAVNFEHIPSGGATIFTSAMSWEAGVGGFLGALIAGVKRASFSNESGLGTAAIIQASAKTEFPVRQGLVGGLGPFFDTVIVCTVTALVIVVSGVYQDATGVSGVDMTSRAFETVIPWFDYALMVCVLMFAFSTIVVYSYYAEKALGYVFGDRKRVVIPFRVIYLGFIVVGCSAQLNNVLDLADAFYLSLAIPNMIGVYLLAREVKRDLTEYLVLMGLKKDKMPSVEA